MPYGVPLANFSQAGIPRDMGHTVARQTHNIEVVWREFINECTYSKKVLKSDTSVP